MPKRATKTSFKPGQSGNPNGRPKIPIDVKESRQLTRIELDRQLNRLIAMSPEQLAEVRKDPKSTMLELLIVSVITHGINKGDQTRLNFLLERLSSIGKVKETVEHLGPNGGPLQIQTAIQHLSLEELYEQYSQKKLASTPKLIQD